MTQRVFRTPEAQLALPVDVEIVPTPAMRNGTSRVDRCSWCELLACVDAGVKLGACPGCGCKTWWRQDCAPFDRAHWSGPFCRRCPATTLAHEGDCR